MAKLMRIVAGLAALALAAFLLLVVVGVYTALDSATAQYSDAASVSQTG